MANCRLPIVVYLLGTDAMWVPHLANTYDSYFYTTKEYTTKETHIVVPQ